MDIYFYNTLTKKKEKFVPLDENEVRMYSCGPTVYDYSHIGNLRAYLFMDSLRRTLKYNGYKLKHVMNITDVGHLTSDADEGEDKMMKAARRENKDPWQIAQYYMDVFLEDLKKLNIDIPEIIARATEHIDIMEQYVKKIIENGYTYQTEDTVYFDTSKLPNYGILSGKNVEEQKAGARVDFDSNKKNVSDFALWIKAPKEHIMQWDSFFGKSYPGWHLECSAMGYKYLGEEFDIHTGGIDHIPIHHENEIAQAQGFCGKIPARFWMHVNFLKIDGGKVSKSLNNFYTLSDLKERGFEPEVFRMFNYSSSYRNALNYTWEGMDASKKALIKLKEGYKNHLNGKDDIADEVINKYEEEFHQAINDDLNMPQALSVVWELIKYPQKSKKIADLLLKFDTVLALKIDEQMENNESEKNIPQEIIELAETRKKARENKDWAESDRLRDLILEKGYTIKDTKDGYEF